MERRAVLIRDESTDRGTRGVLTAGALTLHLMEPPDRDTRPNRSSIPTGLYEVHPHRSPRFGWVLAVADVPGRSHILIHSLNVGGDVELGLHSHTLGCLLPGFRRRKLKVPPDYALSSSGPHLRREKRPVGTESGCQTGSKAVPNVGLDTRAPRKGRGVPPT